MLRRGVLADVDRFACEALKRARIEPGKPVSLLELTRYFLGTYPRFEDIPTEGMLGPAPGGRFEVVVRRGLSPERARFVAGHEFAHWWWREEIGYVGRDIEARCDALGAHIIAPRADILLITERDGYDVERIATALRTTQSVAHLRIGETHDVPVALLRRRRSTIIRGPAFAPWPVALSWQPVKRAVGPGLVKVAISDEPGKLGVRLYSG